LLAQGRISLARQKLRIIQGNALLFIDHAISRGVFVESRKSLRDRQRGNDRWAFGLLATSELKSISKACPETVKEWMEEGLNSFNPMGRGIVRDPAAFPSMNRVSSNDQGSRNSLIALLVITE
jgi:hypothetical protein